MHSYKIMDTPVTRSETLSLEMCPMNEKEKKDMSRVPYSSIFGSLMYDMMCTLPDICYGVSLVSKYQSNLIKDHKKVIKRILWYLKITTDHTLRYSGYDLFMKSYTNVDWDGDPDDTKSTSVFSFLPNGGTISWKSKKQTWISLSSMQYKYVACVSVFNKVVWSKRFFEHLNIEKGF